MTAHDSEVTHWEGQERQLVARMEEMSREILPLVAENARRWIDDEVRSTVAMQSERTHELTDDDLQFLKGQAAQLQDRVSKLVSDRWDSQRWYHREGNVLYEPGDFLHGKPAADVLEQVAAELSSILRRFYSVRPPSITLSLDILESLRRYSELAEQLRAVKGSLSSARKKQAGVQALRRFDQI